MENNKREIFLRVKVNEESLIGKITTALKLEEELREIMVEIRRMVVLEEETR